MVKILYNGEYIELESELEPGTKELDIYTDVDDLEDTKEFNKELDFDNTTEFDFSDMSDTKEFIMEEYNEL